MTEFSRTGERYKPLNSRNPNDPKEDKDIYTYTCHNEITKYQIWRKS